MHRHPHSPTPPPGITLSELSRLVLLRRLARRTHGHALPGVRAIAVLASATRYPSIALLFDRLRGLLSAIRYRLGKRP